MIEAHNLIVQKGRSTLLDDVSLKLQPGQLTAIVGPNGAGKSTLLKCLSGSVSPSSGTVFWNEKPLNTFTPEELARKRAVLSQNSSVQFPFKVRDIVEMGLNPHLSTGLGQKSAEADALIRQSLELAEISALRDRTITSLSGGEQQRAHLARTLCQILHRQNTALFLDEPTSALDLKHQHGTLQLARDFAQEHNAIVVIVLHELRMTLQYCDQAVCLQQGRLVEAGPAKEVLNSSRLAELFDIPERIAKDLTRSFA
ncbi:heme ABC transporter ATP-binding protein [Kiloniella sp. b19]|uniref:heme ABC transporter ATP-binding protein n=1 Tax=Kiloniella sp. GXU_MW_B19 TaxID=3141326 RepID=UPI0031D7A765